MRSRNEQDEKSVREVRQKKNLSGPEKDILIYTPVPLFPKLFGLLRYSSDWRKMPDAFIQLRDMENPSTNYL
jgi:hypothetical protein